MYSIRSSSRTHSFPGIWTSPVWKYRTAVRFNLEIMMLLEFSYLHRHLILEINIIIMDWGFRGEAAWIICSLDVKYWTFFCTDIWMYSAMFNVLFKFWVCKQRHGTNPRTPKDSEVALLSPKYSGAGFEELQLITGNLNNYNLQYLQFNMVTKNHYYYFMKLEILILKKTTSEHHSNPVK